MSQSSLSDYKSHYQIDAQVIVDPAQLNPQIRASERRRLETLVRLVALKEGEILLDIGCGSGWLAHLCHRSGAQVWAMDMAPAGVAAARTRFPQIGRFQAGDVYHLPYAEESFTVAVLSEVVEHLERIETALAEVWRVLRPGGRVLVSVPYRETIIENLCIHCNRFTPSHAHLHSFDESSLAGHLQDAGFEVRRTVLLANKLLQRAGFPRLTQRLPYWSWRGIELLCNRLLPRPAVMGVLAAKPE